STTVYGRRFLLVAVDEAQNLRNIKRSYWALFALRERSESIVAMTATPITNRPMDVWNLGRCLGIEAFSSPYDGEAEKMERNLRTSAVKDRLRFKQGDRDKTIIAANLKGNTQVQIPSLYRNQMLKWIRIIRQRYADIVIHRSVWSVDNVGVRISGLAAFKEHFILVQLYDHEVENLELIAQELIEKGGASTAAKFAGGSNFYIRVRKALLHPSCNPGRLWADPSTLEEWTKDPSRKLDTLVEIIRWHLEVDARAPLRVVDDKLVPSANSANETSLTGGAPCDKVLVYCAFPSSYTQIMKVLQLREIQALQIHGKITIPARTEIITKFKDSGRDGPRVLIVSNVGLTGLNLPCASILIIVDCLWSATEEGQLIGRIYRPPQQKTVHVYRLVAADTQDVFLNNLSFDKAAVLNAFTGATPSL
ncbi:P-loop containing nucleoside triphosphate hydrolase protein, partial [Suillus spraguei]